MSIWTAIAGRLNTLHDLVTGEAARATAAEAAKVNTSTYTAGQAAQAAALTAEATTARAAESAALAAAVAPKDRLVAGGQIAVQAISGGGVDLFNYRWPQWGYGGSAVVANLASPTLIDLAALNLAGLIWMPGQGYSVLDNAIRTPFTTDVAGNSGGVAQRQFVDFDLVLNEYDPVAGQSTYYFYDLPNAHRFYLDETGYLVVKFRDAAKVIYTAQGTEQVTPKTRLTGYYDLNPNNAAAGGVWTLDFYVLSDDGVSYESFGDQIIGAKAITAWKEVLTDQSDVPFTPQSIGIGTGLIGQVYRGGFIHLAVRTGLHTATPVLECSAEPWAVAGGGTHTERGRVFTLTNASAENFVTTSCLAVAPGEYVTLTGDPKAPTSPVTIATTHGLYPTLTASGFSWDVTNPVARDLYRLSNGIVNLAVTPDTRTVPVTVTSAGDIVLDAPKLRIGDDVAATQPYADTTAASARAAAIQISNGYAQEIADELLASIANATPYRETELTLTAGAQRVQYNQVWQVANANHGLPPMGIGDGSPLDQQMVLDQMSPIVAAAGGTGGFGATPTYLTSLVDNATTPVAGSLRKIINDYNAVWAAWAIGGAAGAEPSLYVVAGPGLTVDGSGAAHIALDYSPATSTARDIKILSRRWTFDFTALKGGLILDGGGKPGPIPYCTTDVSVASGTGSRNLHTTSAANFGSTKLRIGATVDVAKYVAGVWTIYGKDLVVTAINYDNPGTKTGPGSIDVTGTMDATAPTGSTVILSYNPTHNDPVTGIREHLEPGQPGCQFIIGGESYSDMFGPGKPNIPAGNGIMRNMAWRSNWGGDILDTGDLNDFAISYWADTVWLDHCDWSNPDPFHDTMWQTAKGTRFIGTSFCAFRNHYKAVNHFGGNAGSGGVSPDGTTPSPNVHPFPPIPGDPLGRSYDETNPGPYAFEPGIVGSHGNPTGAPVVIMSALHEHALFDGLGQRAPKNMHFADMHLLNSVVQNYGLPPGDPILAVSTRFPMDSSDTTNGPYPMITGDYAKSLFESVKIIPSPLATSGGYKGIKHTADGKSPGGYIKTRNLTLVGPVVNEADFDPLGKIPNFAARYPYTAEDATTYVRKVTYGAGAGTQSKMWTLVGGAETALGPGGTAGNIGTAQGDVRYDTGNAKVIHVGPGGSDANTGLLASKPKATLAGALTAMGTGVKGVIRLLPGDIDAGAGISWSAGGYICGIVGPSPLACRIHTTTTQVGPVLDLTGVGYALDDVEIGGFTIEGDGTAGATEKGLALDHSTSFRGYLHDIIVKNTGGTPFDLGCSELATFERLYAFEPVSASANDVPYFSGIGAFNGNTFRDCVLNGLSVGANVGASGAVVITDDGSTTPHDNLLDAFKLENLHLPTNGTIFGLKGNGQMVANSQFFDCAKVSGATGTSHIRLGAPSISNFGGNSITGLIPGKGTNATDIDCGVDVRQSRNTADGVKGYKGTNILLAAGVTNFVGFFRGSISGATDPAVVDSSGSATNVVLDATGGALGLVLGSTSGLAGSAQVGIFTASGTWTKPAGAVSVDVATVAPGSGGGSGRRGAAGTVRCGGGGGSSGPLVRSTLPAASLPATVGVTIGAAGAGGAAVTTDDTNGNDGVNGGANVFAAFLRSGGTFAGKGGTNATGAGGATTSGAMFPNAAGAAASTTGGVGVSAVSTANGAGGASGGGITSADVPGNGGAGQTPSCSPAAAGAAGTTPGGAGGAPTGAQTNVAIPGPSGGGGAASITGPAGAGADGATYGAGGSGGGASLNGNASGKGGAGGPGIMIVVSYF